MQRRRSKGDQSECMRDSIKEGLRDKGLSGKEAQDGCLEATGQNH